MEKPYGGFPLAFLAGWRDCCLLAVDIKGVTPEDFEKNTRKPFNPYMFWNNLERLVNFKVPFYLTFTNPDMRHYETFRDKLAREFGNDILPPK
jgi:hypothetical protein